MKYLNEFRQRASVRDYDHSKTVTLQDIDALLEAASHAPTMGNLQLYSVVVTMDNDAKSKLCQLHFGQPAALNCDALLTFCADIRRFRAWCEARDCRSGFENEGGMLLAIEDATIFAQQFVALAELNGLGTVYLGTVPYNIQGFADALGLVDGVMPLFSIAVGHPLQKPSVSDRLPLDAIRHIEKYAEPTPSDIDIFYAEKENLPTSDGFIKENGKQTLAQVFAEVRYPESLNLCIAKQLLNYFKKD